MKEQKTEAGWSASSTSEVDRTSGRVAWECSHDLTNYTKNCLTTDSSRLASLIRGRAAGITILELGCGRALPALGLLSDLVASGYRGSVRVILQDMDAVTIESVTRASAADSMRLLPSDAQPRVSFEFVTSSWDDFQLSAGEADVILSSECIYREDLFASHAGVIARCLSPDGIAIVAAKRYYFGCGGGTIDFAEFLENSSLGLKSQLVQVFENGMSNTREILEVFS